MNLHPDACEYYRLKITTTVPVGAGTWEASFDVGETWTPATVIDGLSCWLVCGPGYAESLDPPGPARLERDVTPRVRIVDSPETILKAAPRIYVTDL